MGAISWCSSLRILGEITSWPEGLFGESPCSNLSTPSYDISQLTRVSVVEVEHLLACLLFR